MKNLSKATYAQLAQLIENYNIIPFSQYTEVSTLNNMSDEVSALEAEVTARLNRTSKREYSLMCQNMLEDVSGILSVISARINVIESSSIVSPKADVPTSDVLMDQMLQRVPSTIVESARRHLMAHWNNVTSTSEDTERLVAQYASDVDAMKFLDWREMVDIVNDPGKFEGELNIVIRMWETANEGYGTDVYVGDTQYSFISVLSIDETLAQLFKGELHGARLWEDSNGFVRSEWYATESEYQDAIRELEAEARAESEDESEDQEESSYVEYGEACDDCVIAIANDDYSGMDDETAEKVSTALDAVGHLLIVGDETGFSNSRCDICGSLAGNRHTVGYIQDGAE